MRRVGLLMTMLFVALVFSCFTADMGAANRLPRLEEPGEIGDEAVYEVIMSLPTTVKASPDLFLVQEEINKITVEEIGVRVRLLPAEGDWSRQYSLMLAGNEKLDLMLVRQGGLGTYVAKNQLLALDELVALRGQDILEAEGIATAGGYFGGHLYAVPSEEKMGRSYGVLARSDLIEKYAIDIEAIHSYRDLEPVFQLIRHNEPDMIPFAHNNTLSYFCELDTLGATLASGCLLDGGQGDMTIVNLFATEQYEEFVRDMRRWNRQSFFLDNVLLNTKSALSLVQEGTAFSYSLGTELGMAQASSNNAGWAMTAIPLTKAYATTSMYQISLWAIPATCENPEKTMDFLNLTYVDERIANLLSNGIEGLHYEKTEHPMIIRRPDGVTALNSGYEVPGKRFGNKMLVYSWEPTSPDIYRQTELFNRDVLEHGTSIALGYVFDSSEFHKELTEIGSVLEQYQMALETGSVDPDVMLPEFRHRLELAGIDRVIAENQRQLDGWLVENGKLPLNGEDVAVS